MNVLTSPDVLYRLQGVAIGLLIAYFIVALSR
jgi:hypothetical protein